MRVLFLATAVPPRAGSAESGVLRLATALAGQGATVRVIAPTLEDDAADERIGDVVIERFRVPAQSDVARAVRLIEHAPSSHVFRPRPLALLKLLGAEFVTAVRSRRDFEPDVVHAIQCFPDGLVGTWVGSLASVPVVTTVTESDLRLARRVAASRPTLRHVLRRSAGVTATSSVAAVELARLLSLPQPTVVPLPARHAEHDGDASRRTDRLLCHVPGGSAGWAQVVLEALAATRTRVAIDVVGDAEVREPLGRIATSLRIPDRVRWIGAPSPDALADLVSSAAAVIVADQNGDAESLAAEALLAETPVVAVGEGGIADMLQHDRTGIRVRAGDPVGLAHAVDALLERPDRGASLGAAGRLHALATYAPESVARRLVRLYQETIGAPAS
ncbi:MAG TPA: glycosyltransferase family 4 protein [Gemmatimonadaceae bacterium]|nr:glycosyltransferase family 4 protein [Gemmatimonadaceae bacterium]